MTVPEKRKKEINMPPNPKQNSLVFQPATIATRFAKMEWIAKTSLIKYYLFITWLNITLLFLKNLKVPINTYLLVRAERKWDIIDGWMKMISVPDKVGHRTGRNGTCVLQTDHAGQTDGLCHLGLTRKKTMAIVNLLWNRPTGPGIFEVLGGCEYGTKPL